MSDLIKGAAAHLIEQQFGGPTTETEAVVATGAAPVSIGGGNPDAVGLVLINLGANTVYLALDQRVSATRGIAVGANGGTVIMNVLNDATLPTREWFAVSPVGASSLYVLRTVRYSVAGG